MTNTINEFWLNFINGSRGIWILKLEHGMEEGSLEKTDIVCNSCSEASAWSYEPLPIGT